ncbi:FAD-dependent oxidoreductase [Thalassotalea ganghwensis]
MTKVVIVGAGLLGRLLALLLEKSDVDQQLTIVLLEKHSLSDAKATGRIAAGMVAPLAESVSMDDTLVAMGARTLELWPKLLAYLSLNVSCWQQGSLVIAHRQDSADLSHFIQRLRPQSGLDYCHLDASQLHQLEPELSTKFQQGLFLPGEAHIDNQQLYLQSEQLLRASRIEITEKSTFKLAKFQQVSLENQKNCDWLIDCRGLGAKNELLEQQQGLRGIRGEVIRVFAPEVNLNRPIRVMHPRYPIYIVPKGQHHYVIGATEIESHDDSAITMQSAMELMSAAYSIHSGFAQANVIAMQTGLRPTFYHHKPRIYQYQQQIQVNGLYRHGYLLAPYLLEQLLLMLQQHGLVAEHALYQCFGAITTLDKRLVRQEVLP